MDYHKWKSDRVPLSRLKLDPENPRLGTGIQRLTQEELIAELLRLGKVYDLARDIARQGFMPTEVLVAIRSGVNLVVIEGNERLAALKLLSNPALAPAAYIKRIKALSVSLKYPLPSKIPVTVAPSREATIPLVTEKHNGKTIDAWTRVMQSRYITSLIDGGISVDDAVDIYGLDRGEVVRALWESRLYDVIRSLDLPAHVQQTVRDPRAFPFTTLTRLFETATVQQSLGAKLSEEHGFIVAGPQEIFKDRLAAIVSDIVDEKVTSRTINKAEDISVYLHGRFSGTAGKSSRVHVGVPALSFVDPARIEASPPKPAKKQRKAATPKESPSVVPRGFTCTVVDSRIQDIFSELRRLKLVDFPNAVAITFRSLVDMAVTKYNQDSGELKKMLDKDKVKNPNRKPDWLPSLGQQLTHLLDEPSVPLPPEGRKSLRKFLTDTHNSMTLDTLNWFTHVRYVPPTTEQMRGFWVMLTPLLELTLKLHP